MKNLIQSCLILLLCAGSLTASSQVPVLNSYPSATPTIFLDFDGHTVSGTSWNVSGPIYCGASGLNDAQITEVFNRVAEDYRPFTVNITTDSTKYLSAPANRRMRVIITVTSSWYGSAGGVAFVNSFTWGDNTPCFVFSALLSYNQKNIAEASSHEAGHTLGLRHQSTYDASCVKTSEYNYGVGSGETSWAPIMGAGYSKNLTTWYDGPNSISCSTFQKDLDVITSATNGITYRSDDNATGFSTAPMQTFTNNVFNNNGLIERNTDQDLFKFNIPSLKLFQLSAVPFNVGSNNAGSNLDLKVSLYNSSQNLISIYTSNSTLNLIVDTSLNTGTYYFKIEGVGSTYAPSYGILGSYSVQGELIENSALPLHKLELKGTFSQDKHILNWNIQADESIAEQILEVSTDGKNFSQLTQPGNTDRSYSYRPVNTKAALYRVYVEFGNGSHYYSNIVAIKQPNDIYKPKLVNSLVTNGIITVTSPAIFDYSLFDLNGKVLNKGKLANGMNTINADRMINGIYLIRFTDGGQQWTEKLVKQ
jgi:hypothetical protein